MSLRVALLIAPILLSAGPAFAGHSPLEDARKLTNDATVEYNVGRFEEALALYTKAYERYPKAALLFDIGQCHRLLGHHERALFFYQGYLREHPNAPNRALVETFVEDAQRELDAQRAEQEAKARTRVVEEAARSQTAESVPTPVSRTSAEPLLSPPVAGADSTSGLVRTVGFATAGVGGLLVGGGIYAGLHSASLANQISDLSAKQGTWTPQAQSTYSSGKSWATVANVLYVSGGAALAAGVALAWFGWPKSAPATASIAPLPGGAAVGLFARF